LITKLFPDWSLAENQHTSTTISEVSESGNPDDATLLAQLDVSDRRADAWSQLLAVTDQFAALPHAEGDFRWEPPKTRLDGVITVGYPIYGDRVALACDALAKVGAVTPAYHWMRQLPLPLPDNDLLPSPADAIRMATAMIRGERFGDGVIAKAVQTGTFQAILASLATWHRMQPH
jgi:hypothetical protein